MKWASNIVHMRTSTISMNSHVSSNSDTPILELCKILGSCHIQGPQFFWCNAHHGNTRMWVDRDGNGGFKHPSGKGKRLIILHAGAVAGWLPQTELIFRSKSKNNGDYHNEMN